MTFPSAHLLRRRTAARGGLRLLAAACALLAVVVSAASGWGGVPLPVVALLAAVVAAAEVVALPARLGPSRWAASLTDGAVAACLLVGAGAWSVVAVGIGVAAAQLVRRCPRRTRELDLPVRLLATAVAQAVCGAVGGGPAGAVTGVAVSWLLTSLLLAVAVAAVAPRPVTSLLRWIARRSALPTVAGAGAGLLAVELALRAPLGLLGLALGLAVAGSAHVGAAERRGETRLLTHLAHAPGRTPDASAQLLVTAAARLLGGADVELVLLDGPLARCFTGDERGRVGGSSDAVALDAPWVLEALAAPGVRHGCEDGRPTLSAVVQRAGRPRAVLRARRAAGAPGFDRQDLGGVDVLVARADAWLVAPPDGVDAAGEPAVGRVRASVDRLDALAGLSAPAPEVADALHELQRSVASLLGTAGLAAAVPLQRSAPAAEWTTTGAVR